MVVVLAMGILLVTGCGATSPAEKEAAKALLRSQLKKLGQLPGGRLPKRLQVLSETEQLRLTKQLSSAHSATSLIDASTAKAHLRWLYNEGPRDVVCDGLEWHKEIENGSLTSQEFANLERVKLQVQKEKAGAWVSLRTTSTTLWVTSEQARLASWAST
jgi:hypothetical protein